MAQTENIVEKQPVQPTEPTRPTPPEQPVSARDRYRSRYQEKHPDLNLDDDEAFYGQANQNLDELENWRESNRQLGEALDNNPLLGGLLLAAREGENPFTYLAEQVGTDLDVRRLADDPEFGTKMGEALSKYQETLAEGAKQEKEIGEHFTESMNALKQLQEERGMSDEDAQALVKKMFGETDEEGNVTDYGIIGNASMGIVPKEVWEAVLKAQSYDADIKAAGDRAAAQALNSREQNSLRRFGRSAGVPNLGTNGGGHPATRKKSNSLADFGRTLMEE